MSRAWLLVALIPMAGCEPVAHWDEIRNEPEQQIHDAQVCVAGGMDYAKNAYGEVKCIHPRTGDEK